MSTTYVTEFETDRGHGARSFSDDYTFGMILDTRADGDITIGTRVSTLTDFVEVSATTGPINDQKSIALRMNRAAAAALIAELSAGLANETDFITTV